ncbi:MAG: hypothetical protein IJ723_04505, partial [Ruminococcus sp.]|nr:hypothetical protein [Ruminococcus sp.]
CDEVFSSYNGELTDDPNVSHPYLYSEDFVPVSINYSFGYYNIDGKCVVKSSEFSQARPVHHGKAWVSNGNAWGVIRFGEEEEEETTTTTTTTTTTAWSTSSYDDSEYYTDQPSLTFTQPPEFTQPDDSEIDTEYTDSEPEYTEPEYTEPEYTEPEYTEPEYTEPEYTEPEYTDPDPGWEEPTY